MNKAVRCILWWTFKYLISNNTIESSYFKDLKKKNMWDIRTFFIDFKSLSK